MKNLLSRRSLRPLTLAFCALSPVSMLIIPGCGGGSSSIIPTTISTAPFDLGNGQNAALALSRVSNTISGTITIANGTINTAAKTTKAITVQIPPGTYPVSGTVDSSGNYNLTGTFPTVGDITLSGVLPTINNTGTFTLTAGGQTATGTIPALSSIIPTTSPTTSATTTPTTQTSATPAPTNTPRPTATTAPTSAPAVSRIENPRLSAKSSNFNGAGFTAALTTNTPNFSNSSNFSPSNIKIGNNTYILFEGPVLNRPARVGDTFKLGNVAASTGILYYGESGNKSWESTTGTLIVTVATTKSVSFTLKDITFAPQSFGTTSATGTFTLNADGVLNGS